MDENETRPAMRHLPAMRFLPWGIAAWCVAVIAVRFAEPVLDGDLFWQMKYAEQMLARGTLVPDHTLYSWTPASNAMIYCTWLSQLVLYALYQIGGLPILFVLRYACLAGAAVLLLMHARALGIGDRLAVWAVVLLSLLASTVGTIIKPELFSFAAFHLVIFCYCRARMADRAGEDVRNWLLSIPLIVLAWANSHGGFIMAAPFFVATFSGDLLARRYAPARALSGVALKWMLAAWALSGLAVIATPYGWRYPWQLVNDFVLRSTPRPDEIWNAAHQSVLSPQGSVELLYYGIFLLLAAAGLLVLAGRRIAGIDFGLLIACLCYGPLYLLYGRTTFYFAILFGYVGLQLLAAGTEDEGETTATRPAWQRGTSVAAVLLILSIGATALYVARGPASRGSWIGFGVSHVNPVAEAEFLAASKLGPRLYNLFDSGGYLLWRLYPSYRVMVDQRSFPYLNWFDEQYRFAHGQDFEAFQKKYPADTAVIDLTKIAVWRNFLRSKDWRLAYYGPSAAVFTHSSVPEGRAARDVAPGRFDDIGNGNTALHLFDFAVIVGDYPVAWKVLAQLEPGLHRHVERIHVERSVALREAHHTLAAGQFDRARALFEQAAKRPLQGWREPVIHKLLEARAAATARGDIAGAHAQEAALRQLALPAGQL